MLKVTTSWDDGDVLDKKLADLLDQYGMKGTFYIAKDYRPKRLSEDEIRDITRNHEIGAHTLTHPDLRQLNEEEQRAEIAGSKTWLESILGKEVCMFCYPSGKYDETAARMAREAGFKGARTTKPGSVALTEKPFEMETTIQVYPLPFRKLGTNSYYWGKLFEPLFERYVDLRKIGVSPWAMRSWITAAKAAFNHALKNGDTFHLWGHSWEIEQYDMWNELEELLAYIRAKNNCEYVTNSELIKG